MSRAFVILTVFTLVAGPDAAIMCGTWCDQGGRTAGACRHEAVANAPVVSASDCCAEEALGVPVVLSQARFNVSTPNGAHATVGLHFAVALPANRGHLGHDSARLGSFDHRPLTTILRI